MTATSSLRTRLIPAVAAVCLIFILYLTPSFHLPTPQITIPELSLDTSAIFGVEVTDPLKTTTQPVQEDASPALIETLPPIIPDEAIPAVKEIPAVEETAVSVHTPGLSYDIVVSYYNENITAMAERIVQVVQLPVLKDYARIRVFVYVKNEKQWVDEVRQALLEANMVTAQVLEPIVIQSPNLGREGGTFMRHIYERWDDIASHTMLIQAEMHFHDDALNQLTDYLIPATGVLNLGMYMVCECLTCAEPWDYTRLFPRLLEIHSMVSKKFCEGQLPLSYLGQLVVSEKRIRINSRDFYKMMLDTIESDMDGFIHKDPRQDEFNDDPSNPYFGHTMERAYLVLFGAYNATVAHSCGFGIPGLVHRKPADEPYSKCQWLDEE
jgi:hypothetical protein